jgi:hypothetical protein
MSAKALSPLPKAVLTVVKLDDEIGGRTLADHTPALEGRSVAVAHDELVSAACKHKRQLHKRVCAKPRVGVTCELARGCGIGFTNAEANKLRVHAKACS